MPRSRLVLMVLLCTVISGCDKVQAFLDARAHQQALKTSLVESGKLQDDGNSNAAIESFKKIEADPAATDQQKATALRYISLSYYELGDYPRSGDYAEKAAKYYPAGSYYYLVNMADADLMHGKIPSARDRLEQAVKIKPYDLAANNVLGLLYLGDNGDEYADFHKALAYNQAAFDIAPGRITQIVLVRNLIKVGQFPKADAHLAELKQKYPSDTRLRSLQQQLEQARAQQ